MLIYCWNVRGLNNPLKQHEVVSLMKKLKIDVCGLLETKLSLPRLVNFYNFRLKQWKYISNANVSNVARVVVLWNPNTVHVELIDVSAQGIHVHICCLANHYRFATTFVYRYNTITVRRLLW